MSNSTPFISVITAVYNGADYLPDLIESVQAQDFTDYEHIIIDDGSTDDGATIAVIEHYAAHDDRIKWWSRENKGQYTTQNEALHAAQGNYVVVIAADDVFVIPGAFSVIDATIRNHPEHQFIYGKTRRMTESGDALPNIELSWRPSRWLIKHVVYAQHCSVFVNRRFLVENRLFFDESYRYAGDWDWLVRLFTTAKHIGYIKTPLSIIRMHMGQTSRSATKNQIHAEHRRVSDTYGGSYRLHVLFTRLNNYRAMGLIALDTLRTQGIKALWQRIKARTG